MIATPAFQEVLVTRYLAIVVVSLCMLIRRRVWQLDDVPFVWLEKRDRRVRRSQREREPPSPPTRIRFLDLDQRGQLGRLDHLREPGAVHRNSQRPRGSVVTGQIQVTGRPTTAVQFQVG